MRTSDAALPYISDNRKGPQNMKASFFVQKRGDDFSSAAVFDKIRVGAHGIYCPSLLKTVFYSYSDFDRAFLRVYEGTARMCCSSMGYSYVSLVLKRGDKELTEIYSENECAMKATLSEIAKKAPDIAIGVSPAL